MRKILNILYFPYRIIFIPFFFINTIIFGTIGALIAILIGQRFSSVTAGKWWAKTNALLTPMIVEVEGSENIAKNTSYIIVPNHQSYYDIFLIYGWLKIDIRWVMKKELRNVPGLGIASEKIGHIFLDRSNSKNAIASLAIAKERLVNGTSIVMFPEGTRSKTGELGEFKKGAFKMAFDLDLPILPVTLIGTKEILPSGSLNLLPGKVKMIIHKPIDIHSYGREDLDFLIANTRATISKPQKNKGVS